MQDLGYRLEQEFSKRSGFQSIKIQGRQATMVRGAYTTTFSIEPYLYMFYSVVPDFIMGPEYFSGRR
jgi:hypothetical protein